MEDQISHSVKGLAHVLFDQNTSSLFESIDQYSSSPFESIDRGTNAKIMIEANIQGIHFEMSDGTHTVNQCEIC